jgi:putative nucleotidyltransferase with HDIG domain
MRDEILKLLPEINDICDPDLRQKVIAVWIESVTAGDWTPDALTEIPFTLLAGKIEMRFIEHIRSCARQCLAVEKELRAIWGDRVPINHDVLLAGALLADAGKPLEYARQKGELTKSRRGELLRHPFTGVALCYKHGLPDEVMHIVATHSGEGDIMQRSIESIIFHHVDFIDFDIAKALGKRNK